MAETKNYDTIDAEVYAYGTAYDDTVTIPKTLYDKLVAAQELLSALEAGGVNNWEWYWESTKHLYGDDE